MVCCVAVGCHTHDGQGTVSDTSLKGLSYLDDLASVCRRMKNLSKMLAHVEYVMGKFCIC